jgi:antirestriction protein ArdC
MPSKTFTPEERAAYRANKRSEQREQMESAARELLTSDGWQRWAQTRASFHKYSMGNTMLIALQAPDASQVAGFRKWQELGRQVRKGERSIKIMAPMSVKDRDAVGEETGEVRTFFRSVSVFDVAQTDGEDLPEAPREPIEGDSHAAYVGRLERFARVELGFTVEYEPLTEVGGYCSAKSKRIVVSTNVGCPNRHVRVLVHEIAHALGVSCVEYGRDDAEVIVETAAYIVCGAIGLDTSGESVPYVAGWGEESNLDAIRKHAATVDELARKIESAVEA